MHLYYYMRIYDDGALIWKPLGKGSEGALISRHTKQILLANSKLINSDAFLKMSGYRIDLPTHLFSMKDYESNETLALFFERETDAITEWNAAAELPVNFDDLFK